MLAFIPWAVKLSKAVQSIFGRCPSFNHYQEAKYLEEFLSILSACGSTSILIQKIMDLSILLTVCSQLCCHVPLTDRPQAYTSLSVDVALSNNIETSTKQCTLYLKLTRICMEYRFTYLCVICFVFSSEFCVLWRLFIKPFHSFPKILLSATSPHCFSQIRSLHCKTLSCATKCMW